VSSTAVDIEIISRQVEPGSVTSDEQARSVTALHLRVTYPGRQTKILFHFDVPLVGSADGERADVAWELRELAELLRDVGGSKIRSR
jgi:hypothetical protein